MNKISPIVSFVLALAIPLFSQTSEESPPNYRKKPHIAILPLANANAQAKETELGRTVSSMLATALRNQTNFLVLERSQLEKVFDSEEIFAGLSEDKTRKLVQLYEVEVVLVGDVSLINSTLHIDVRLIETGSSEIVVALYGTCQDLRQIREVVEDLAGQLEQKYLRQWMGSLSIISQPHGAEVYLEGKFIGLTDLQNPLNIANLLEGRYHLKLIRGGYFDWEGDISVLAKMERTVTVSLIAKPGSMNIYSEPAGAEVFLDNTLVGETPMSLREVAEGEHEIRLAKQSFEDWIQKVVVRSFQPTDVKATLEISPGTLTVNSDPKDALIFLKGESVARTPYTLFNIPPGELVIRVEKEGFEEWTSSVLIEASKNAVLDIPLKEKRGTLSIISEPAGATIYLWKEGEPQRQIGQTPLLNYNTTIGTYIVEVGKPDFFAEQMRVEVRHEELTEVRTILQERPGEILLESTPENARVLLNNSYKGRAPYLLRDVAKGDYRVTLALPYAQQTQEVRVEPNQKTVVKARFVKSKKYIFAVTAVGAAGFLFHLMARQGAGQ